MNIGEGVYDWLNIGEGVYDWLNIGEGVYAWLNIGEDVFDWMSDIGGLDEGNAVENGGVNGEDDDEDSGGGTFSAYVLVLSDKGSASLRIDFLLPSGAPFLRDVPFCPADFGSSFEIKVDKFNPIALVFLRKVR